MPILWVNLGHYVHGLKHLMTSPVYTMSNTSSLDYQPLNSYIHKKKKCSSQSSLFFMTLKKSTSFQKVIKVPSLLVCKPMCILSQVFNVYTISYYSPYVALELDVGDYSHSVFCCNGYCFSGFQFSDITAVMHAMPSIIIGVPDFGLWFGRKLEAKNWPEIRTLHS